MIGAAPDGKLLLHGPAGRCLVGRGQPFHPTVGAMQVNIGKTWPWAALLVMLAAVGCTTVATRPEPVAALQRFEFAEPQMGAPFRLVFYAPEATTASNAARAVFARITQLNSLLSDYDTDSELSLLSRTSGEGRAVPVGPELWTVLQRAQQLAAQTGGAFDVTVGPYVNLWRKARREKKLPRADLLSEARVAVGWEKVRLDARARTAMLLAPNMRLDLGAIAKGYAADEAIRVLRSLGIVRALAASGGDIVAGDPPPGKKGWRIEVAPLDATNAPPSRFVLLNHAGLSTSGDLFQRLEIDGVRYSHIVNPKTGLGLTDHSLVTVIARDGITADSLDTTVSVLGPEQGLKLVERTPGAAVYLVRRPADQIETRASKRFAAFEDRP